MNSTVKYYKDSLYRHTHCVLLRIEHMSDKSIVLCGYIERQRREDNCRYGDKSEYYDVWSYKSVREPNAYAFMAPQGYVEISKEECDKEIFLYEL